MWALPALGAYSSVSVEYSGGTVGISGDQQIHTDTSMGLQPAYVSAKPSRKALASNFQTSSTAVAFTLISSGACVVDVDLTFRGTFIAAVAASQALVGATAGAFYLRGLDGLAAATTAYTPEFAIAII